MANNNRTDGAKNKESEPKTGGAPNSRPPVSSASTRVGEDTDADDWLDDATGSQPTAVVAATAADSRPDSPASLVGPLESSGREQGVHGHHEEELIEKQHHHHHRHHRHCRQRHQQKHHCQQNHNHLTVRGHLKELIKPDPTVREQRARVVRMSNSPVRSPPLVPDSSKVIRSTDDPNAHSTISGAFRTPSSSRVAVVVDEDQLQARLRESISERKNQLPAAGSGSGGPAESPCRASRPKRRAARPGPKTQPSASSSSRSSSSSSHSTSGSHSSSHDADDEIDGMRSPPPAAIIIPPSVAKSLSNRASARRNSGQQASGGGSSSSSQGPPDGGANSLPAASPPSAAITREQLAYGPLLKPGEVQILYRSPDSDSTSLDRHLKEEQAKLVAPNMRQSPIAIMTMNPTYELQNKPLIIEYPARVENLRLNNTGFSWEVKIPYQISMTTSLYGAHLNQSHRYRLDQFHCHWGADDKQGSEHTVDNNHYSAEMHFVHYNMEKYHTMSKAARHPDGLVVLSVFLEASDDHHNHAELEKIVSHLRHVPLKGQHSIIRQAVHIDNLLPQNRSYWSYQGSLTTPPYFESVTWFIFKHPIRCNRSQIQRFRNLRSSLRADDDGHSIDTNHRKTQPLNGRSIVNYDESATNSSSVLHSANNRSNSSQSHR